MQTLQTIQIRSRNVILFSLVANLFLVTAIGCQPRLETSSLAVQFPPTITVDGSQWTRSDWTKDDDQKLKGYFSKNPSFAENPMLSGEKASYSNSKGLQRYYWVAPTAKSTIWLFLEFKSKTFSRMGEGEGEPFSSQVRS